MLHLKVKPKPWNVLLNRYPAAFQKYDVSIANPYADNTCQIYRQAWSGQGDSCADAGWTQCGDNAGG